MKNIFVIGASRDRIWIRSIIEFLRGHGYESFDWTSHPDWANPENPQCTPLEIAQEDLSEVDRADGVIWLLNRQPSHGAPFEAGYCYALGKPLVVFWPDGRINTTIYGHMFQGANTLEKALEVLLGMKERVA